MTVCTHLDQIQDVTPSTTEGCTECLLTGDHWVHLRECLECGHVGCCDSSPNRHATAHFHATPHPGSPRRLDAPLTLHRYGCLMLQTPFGIVERKPYARRRAAR